MSTDTERLIGRISVDLANVADEERADLWADTVRPLYDVQLLGSSPAQHAFQADAWLLDSLMLSDAKFTSQLIQRRRTHVGNGVAPLVLVETYEYGELHGEICGEPVHLKPGDVHLIDFDREYWARTTPVQARGILLSHEQIGYVPGVHPPFIRVPGETAVGHVLRAALLAAFGALNSTTKAEAPAIARGLISLLRSVLIADAGLAQSHPGYVSARSKAIRDHIEAHLRSDEIDAEEICKRFNISRATLYREFKPEGGIGRYVLHRRLNGALTALAFGPRDRGAVTRAAEQWGFATTSYFSREFRREFGFGPSSIVGKSPSENAMIAADKTTRRSIGPEIAEFLTHL